MHALRISLQDAISRVELGIGGPSIFSTVRITYTEEEEEEEALGSAPKPLSLC